MRKVRADEILSLGAYEGVRDRFRARLIEHKKRRRLIVGPFVSVIFEDHDTVLMQVQEMLRAERISDPRAVRDELDAYNPLVPPDGALAATLMIEINDEPERERQRRALLGFDKAVTLHLGDRAVPAEFSPEGLFEDRIAVVQYLTFALGDDGRDRLLDFSEPARLAITHPRYAHEVSVPDAMRASLANDLDPLNRESP